MEEDIAVFGEDCDGLLFKEDTAVMVTERSYSNQAMAEARYDVASDVQQL